MKTCKKCNIEKETTEYYNQKNYRDGLDPMCIECRKISNKNYHDLHTEKLSQKSKKWREENVERDREAKRRYYLKHREKLLAYGKQKRLEKKNEEN